MVHGLLIGGSADAAELIGRLIRTSNQISLDRFFRQLPSPYELTNTLQTLAIDAIFLDVASDSAALPIAQHLRSEWPGVALIGFSTTSVGNVPKNVTEFTLGLPLSVEDLLATTRAAMCAGLPGPYTKLAAILPSKAGCGASTIAMNVAAQLAAQERRVILIEGDLRSGAIGDCLGLEPRVPVAETLSLSDVAGQLIWARHVTRKDDVDFLLTDRNPQGARPAWHSYYHLLRFLSERYDHVIVDLPELTNDATSFVLQLASHVYVAATPEPLSLKLAQQRLRELEDAGVNPSSVGVLVNRSERGSLSPSDIATALGHPVEAVFPNDFRTVAAAIHQQMFVPAKSKLGQAYRSFAATLTSYQQKRDPAPAGLLGALRFSRRSV
jgi:cellulose biosynthesis protein BcsQ